MATGDEEGAVMQRVDIGPKRTQMLEDYYSSIASRARESTQAGAHASLRLDGVRHAMALLGYHFVEHQPDHWVLERL
jgi:hypothetical protein